MKKGGCLSTIIKLFFGLILFSLILPVAIIGGIIYLMVTLYKKGKFDSVTEKTNVLISNLYNKIFKKTLNKPVFSPKSFTIVTTIIIFLFIGIIGQDSTTKIENNTSQIESSVDTQIPTDVEKNKTNTENSVKEVSNVVENKETESYDDTNDNSSSTVTQNENDLSSDYNEDNSLSNDNVDNDEIVESTNGNTTETESAPESQSSGNIVYANGGSSTSNKYHSSPTAHNMEGAIPMSEEDAKAQGYVPCKKCY